MKPTNYVSTRYQFDLNTEGIGILYHTFLSTILHDAIPNHARPDDISQKHLAINALCTIIVMELLLIHWRHLSKYLKFYYNGGSRKHIFSKLLSEMSEQVSSSNTTISNRLGNMHAQLMNIIRIAEMEIKNYKSNFNDYVKHVQSARFAQLHDRPFTYLNI